MHATRDDLLALRDGEGAPEAEAHLAACPRCARELERLGETADALKALPILRPPAYGWPPLRDRLREPALLPAVGAIWAALLLVLLSVSLFVLMRQTPPQEDPLAVRQRMAAREKIEPLKAKSRTLESVLAGYRARVGVQSGATAGTIAYLEDGLAIVDLQLSLFQAGEPEPEKLLRLWEERVKLLSALVQVNATPGALAQI